MLHAERQHGGCEYACGDCIAYRDFTKRQNEDNSSREKRPPRKGKMLRKERQLACVHGSDRVEHGKHAIGHGADRKRKQRREMHIFHVVINRGAGYACNQICARRNRRAAIAEKRAGKDCARGNEFIHAAAARKRHEDYPHRANNAETCAKRVGKHCGKRKCNQNK